MTVVLWSLYSYVELLYRKQKVTAANHGQETPVRSIDKDTQLTILLITQNYHLQLDSLVKDIASEIEYRISLNKSPGVYLLK